MAQALFVTLNDVKKFTALNGNIDSDRLIQSIKVAQDIELQTYLGHDLFEKINDDIVASTLASPYTTLLSDYIKPMLIWYAFSDYLSFGAYHISNKGIYKATNEVGETIDSNEVDKLKALCNLVSVIGIERSHTATFFLLQTIFFKSSCAPSNE